MLTGHNTEIHHDEIAFHVQTEDKGRDNPVIVSLIYVGGRVLAAKRTSYGELLAKGLGEKDIAEVMDRQHRTMLAAIRRGRFDEQVRQRFAPREAGTAVVPGEAVDRGESVARGESDGDHALEDLGQSLDEMVSEYLGAEAPESLALVLEPGAQPRAGEESEIALQVLAMPGSRGIGGAEVRLEVISPFASPRLLASGTTDESGRWSQRILVPDSMGGLAALIVAVRCPLGDAEQKILL